MRADAQAGARAQMPQENRGDQRGFVAASPAETRTQGPRAHKVGWRGKPENAEKTACARLVAQATGCA